MPYRRLPNTDQARLRALKNTLQMGMRLNSYDLAFSYKLFLELQAFLPQYEQAITQYNFSKDRQTKYGKMLTEQFKKCRLYVSHYIQVFNFCVLRNEIKPEARKLLGLNTDEKTVPELGTEQQLMQVGKSLIQGEENRMAQGGGTRIYNPSIAIVKVQFDKFQEYYNNHKNLLVTSQKMRDKVVDMRGKADALIVNLWNEIEAKFDHLPPQEKRAKAADYGIVYFLRPHEKEQLANHHSDN